MTKAHQEYVLDQATFDRLTGNNYLRRPVYECYAVNCLFLEERGTRRFRVHDKVISRYRKSGAIWYHAECLEAMRI